MGIVEFLVLAVIVVLLAAGAIWAMNCFAPSPIPAVVPKLIWGIVIVLLLWVLASATGLLNYDIQIPRIR